MKLGILSDTHGHLGRTSAAAKLMTAYGVGAVVHCGDIGTSTVLVELSLEFAPRQVPVYAVTGNVDMFNRDIYPFTEAEGIEVLGAFGDLTLAGKRIAIAHGHEQDRLAQAVQSARFDYVLTGHTHRAADNRIGSTRVINPGACYRSADPSIAVLNLVSGQLDTLPLP